MINWLKRTNLILPEMLGILFVHAVLVELIGIWFVKNKIFYSLGVLAGFLLACFMLIHMAVIIEDSLSVMDKKGRVWISIKSALRYIVIAVVVVSMVYFQWGNFLSCFITMFGVKMAAYLQPFLHKRFDKKNLKEVNE